MSEIELAPETRARVDEWCRVMRERWDALFLRDVDDLEEELVNYARSRGASNTTILKVQAGQDLVMEPWPLEVPEWASSVRISVDDWPEVEATFEGVEHRVGDVVARLCESHMIAVEEDCAPVTDDPKPIAAGSVDIVGPEVVVSSKEQLQRFGVAEARYSCRDAVALVAVLEGALREFERLP